LRDRSLAEDVLQETFLKLYQMKDHVDQELSIPGLLRKISINLSIDILRKRGRERSLQENEEEDQGSTRSIHIPLMQVDANEVVTVRELLERLPSVDRLILELRYGEQLSYAEISQALDISVPAVAQRIRRGKDALRREFVSGKRGTV